MAPTGHRLLRALLAAVGLCGALVFGAAWAASLAAPGWVEQLGRALVRQQVEQRVGEKIDALDTATLTRLAERLGGEQAQRAARAARQLREGLPAQVAAVTARMLQLDCACRQNIQRSLERGMLHVLTDARRLQQRVDGMIRAQYMDTAARLIGEFRIFTGANALVFALLAAAVFCRPRAGAHLLPAALVLLLAAGVTGGLYLFNQNWLHTVVFADYVGWAYLLYLALASALLGDVLLNRGRATARVASSISVDLSLC
jgi:hypothetical protein